MARAKRVFSGIQPTGEVHLGNYVGALRNWARLINDYDCVYSLVDYHAITLPYPPAEMPGRIHEAAVAVVAAGVNPERAILFVQSEVPEHTELQWVFAAITSLGALERMTQFKEKGAEQASQNLGLLAYPVLQAADILLYKGELVPVGEDQVQHLELSREIARKFNGTFRPIFPEPQPLLTPTPRIMGVDGKTKMSKSRGNTIPVLETPEQTWDRLRTAVTDENRKRRSDPGDPDVCNIFTLHKAFSRAEDVEMVNRECRIAGIGCIDCKNLLHKNLTSELEPVRMRAAELGEHPERVREILDAGAVKARAIATPVMGEVREALGLRSPVQAPAPSTPVQAPLVR
jgi:tryptophanyl-tRNA synthetase